MSYTHFDGPLITGSKQAGTPGGANVGFAVMSQVVVVQRDATLVQTTQFKLPAGSQILDAMVDVPVAYDSATSATFTLGSAAGGPQYLSGLNAKTAGRAAIAPSAGQLTAMNDIGNNETVYATVTSVGQPTVGTVQLTLLYIQKR
jgi:hypothetical protein